MAFVNMNLFSDTLNMDTDVAVLLPEVRHGADTFHPDRKYPVVYVLHGYGDNHTAWIRKSTIEMVARNLECIVVMPACKNSFYLNGVNGFDYYDYITKELPLKMANWFPVSTKREDTFIMGNSMGGYGAFMIAMKNPGQYAAAFNFSGVLSLSYNYDHLFNADPKMKKQFRCTVADAEQFDSEYSLYRLSQELDRYEGEKPRLYAVCGTEDDLCLDGCNKFIDYTRKNTALDIAYTTSQGGHDFFFWNQYIKTAFNFFGLTQKVNSPMQQ